MAIVAKLADITTMRVGAIVNAANSSLLGGAGVDGAIHRAAGPELLEECKRIRKNQLPDGLPVGHAVATRAYNLPSFWVIHTVGPNKHVGQDDPYLLQDAFRNSLDLAAKIGVYDVAFPAISAGAFGWTMEEVAPIAVSTVKDWFDAQSSSCTSVRAVYFALVSEYARDLFESYL